MSRPGRKLAAVVKRLEAGGLTLEQSLELWERGERLAAVCGESLDGARARLAAAMAKNGRRRPGRGRGRRPLLISPVTPASLRGPLPGSRSGRAAAG